MYDDILFPTDGSPGSETALAHALDHAVTYGSRLHLLYVIEENLPVVDITDHDAFEALEAEGERVLEDARAEAEAAGVDGVETAVVGGTPYRQILRYVDEHGIDLVVMGTHGRRGVDRYLLGSVAEKVVRSADCPVLTVRQNDD